MNGIEEKIRKLLALAINNSNEAEAASAMAKARELMLKHAINEAALQGKEIAADTDVFIIDLDRVFENWMRVTQSAVCYLFDAQLIWSKTRSKTSGRYVDVATIVCSKHDLPHIKAAYYSAMAQIDAAARACMQDRKFTNSFKLGAANGFLRACRQSVRQDTPEMTAIVQVKSTAIVAEVQRRFGGNLRTANLNSRPSDYSAYDEGYQFGVNMSTSKARHELEA